MSIIRPQPGPQWDFLQSNADIVVYGGAAGGGKTFGLLLDPLRHVGNPRFGAVVFRRTSKQVSNEGGLWDESCNLYPHLKAVPLEYKLRWDFPPGAKIAFANLEHEKDKHNYQGAQITGLYFDELTHFSKSQFFYMLSRNRSTCGVRPYVRATCNPDADSWVADLISWWIDQETGYPIPERSGVVRWMVNESGKLHWYDTEAEAAKDWPAIPPKSFTFIPSKLQDNQILMEKDPGYLANLMALPLVDRERLLGGNWKIRPTAGLMFRHEWLSQVVERVPLMNPRMRTSVKAVRYWDLAASENGDHTCGCLIVDPGDGFLYIDSVVKGKWTPGERDRVIEATAEFDLTQWPTTELWFEREGGSGGKESAWIGARKFAKYGPHYDPASTKGSKVDRAKPLSAACENGVIKLVRGPWNREFVDELVNFPPPKDGVAVDDQVDAASGAFNKLQLRGKRRSGGIPKGVAAMIRR